MSVCHIILPWPEKALWQNRKGHWGKRARATKEARQAAFWTAREAKVGTWPEFGTYSLTFTFNPPDRRKRDLHNMPATQKAAIDGIADALGVDDSRFRCSWPEEFGPPDGGKGSVLVELRGVSNG